MLVQGRSFEAHFGLIMMRVPLVFGAPIATNKEMLRDKVTRNGHSVHGASLLLRLRRQRAAQAARSPPLCGRRAASLTAARSLPLRGQRGRSLTRPLPFTPHTSIALGSLPLDAGRAWHTPGPPASRENGV